MVDALYAWIKSVHFISLYMMLGGPLFWYVLWLPAWRHEAKLDDTTVGRRVSFGLAFGTLFFIAAAWADALRAAGHIFDVTDGALLFRFMTVTRMGRITLAKTALAVLFAGSFFIGLFLSEARPGARAAHPAFLPSRLQVRALASAIGCLTGLGLVVCVSLASHAAGAPGYGPIVSDAVHVLSSSLWAGGLMYLSLVPWHRLSRQRARLAFSVSSMLHRFSRIAVAAVVLVTVTGLFIASRSIFIPVVMRETTYGRTLAVKLMLFALVLLAAGINRYVFIPRLDRWHRWAHAIGSEGLGKLYRWMGFCMRAETGVLLLLLTAAAVLTTLPPPHGAEVMQPQRWQGEVGPLTVQVAIVPLGQPGRFEVDVLATTADGTPVPADTSVSVQTELAAHPMGARFFTAHPVTTGLYRAAPVVSMPGLWHVVIRIDTGDGRSWSLTVPMQASSFH